MKSYVKDCKWGRFVLLRGDMVSQYADLYGEWCEPEVALFGRVLRPESNVIEVGAHIGLHAVPLSKLASRGRVVCFEPQRILHQLLCANLALNDRINVYARHCAVSNLSGMVEVASTNYDTPWNYGSFSIDRGFNTEGSFSGEHWSESVVVTALDHDGLVRSLDSLSLLKIDVEGLETAVLEGGRELIARHRPFIFVENNKEEKSAELIESLRELGYKCFWYCSERFRPGNFNQVTWRLPGVDTNMFCVPVEGQHETFGLREVKAYSDLREGGVPLVVA